MKFLKQLKSSSLATAIIVLLVFVLWAFGFIPWNTSLFACFLIGAVLLAVGQSVFLVAIEEGVIRIGKNVGSTLMTKKNLWLLLLFGFLFGLVSTIAEPDVQVLISQLLDINPFISSFLLLLIFGLGSGLFVAFAVFRILKGIPLKWVLLVLYAIIFVLAYFAPESYFGLAFDSGGVATGTITVPFLLSLIIGICALKADGGKSDSFGAVAIASAGPIIATLILGIIAGEPTGSYVYEQQSFSFWEIMLAQFKDVALALFPLGVLFILTQLVLLKTSFKHCLKSFLGVVVAGLGLVVFLTGINFGFTNMGVFIGENILEMSNQFVLLLFGFVIGLTLVFTDPATIILVEQIQDVTSGFLKKKAVFISVGIGAGVAIVLAMLHILYSIELWLIMLPLYALMIVLNFFIPKIFTAIAFDSGGIAAGTMVVAFVLPIFVGLCSVLANNVMLFAFGIVGLVATVPILSIQILGLIYKLKVRKEKDNG